MTIICLPVKELIIVVVDKKKWKSMMKYAGQDTNSDKVNEYIK